MKKLVLIGDSIRMDYQPFVMNQLGNQVEIWGPEDNCRDSQYLLDHCDEWIMQTKPDILHINCGLHDLRRDFGKPPRNSIDKYKNNLNEIFTRAVSIPNVKIIWATITPVNEKWHHEKKGFDRFEQDVIDFNEAALEIVKKFGLQVNDLYKFVMTNGKDTMLRSDGVHYPPEMSERLATQVVHKIKELI